MPMEDPSVLLSIFTSSACHRSTPSKCRNMSSSRCLDKGSTTGIIDIDKKGDVDSHKSKKKRMHSWDVPKNSIAQVIDSAPLEQDLNEHTPKMSGHSSEEVTSGVFTTTSII
ncbi:hypothetical protein HAX54_031052 [Datura stramonium]|uniref:Uncharacterized protein n=1 Tax=Datura stramonium TaxID=4076 RepID=A0ABS8V9A0_DATST|nr:hypothetical protein [Datura stramonium]